MSTKNSVSSLGPLQDAVDRRLRQMDEGHIVERVWARDPTVWKPDPKTPEITNRLGWLTVADAMLHAAPDLQRFAEEVRGRFDRVVLCGMGGSSLAPEVLRRTFGSRAGFPQLTVLDTTEPGTVDAVGSTGGLRHRTTRARSRSGDDGPARRPGCDPLLGRHHRRAEGVFAELTPRHRRAAREDAVHRLQQVGHHAGDGQPRGALLEGHG